MLLRKIQPYSSNPQYRNMLLYVIRIFPQSKQMNYSLGFPLRHFICRHNNFQFLSSVVNYILHQFNLKYSHKIIIDEIQSLCDFILSENYNYESERTQELKKIIKFLLSKGYSNKDIKEKFITSLKSNNCSYVKFCLLADIDSDIAILLPLLSLPVSVLKKAASKASIDKPVVKEFQNRIMYLSYHLELKPYQLIPALVKHSSLLTMQFKRLDFKMNILKNANINSKYIVKDLWIFNYNEQLLDNRIKAALKAGVELKPWMLRCSEKTFESILIKYSETHRILDGENLCTYLSKKLDCSAEYVNYMMERNKLLKSINVPKLEQIINFLYEKGYTPEEVRLFPRIFCSSLQTLEKRYEELKDVKSTLPTLAQLCMSNKKLLSTLKQVK